MKLLKPTIDQAAVIKEVKLSKKTKNLQDDIDKL